MKISDITRTVMEADDRAKLLQREYNDAFEDYHSLKDRLGPDARETIFALQILKKVQQRLEEFEKESQNRPAVSTEIPHSDVNSPYHHYRPRGGFTLDKIRKHLRSNSSSRSSGSLDKLYDDKGRSSFAREIRRFGSYQEFADHLFFHGTGGYISGGLKPGGILSKGTTLGGGYDEPYHVISLSKSKEIASGFTGDSRFGTVHPVLLKKGAKVISMPQFSDSQELEDILPQLWDKGIDAVRIGDWSSPHSEQELCVVNPNAIILGGGENFHVFNKKKFDEPTREQIADVYRQAFNPPGKSSV
jgi:hypothetical protein